MALRVGLHQGNFAIPQDSLLAGSHVDFILLACTCGVRTLI